MNKFLGYTNYKAEFSDGFFVVDCSFEDETMLVVKNKKEEIVNSFGMPYKYFPHCLTAMKDVLNTLDGVFSLERVVADDPDYRWRVTAKKDNRENYALQIKYEEDGREPCEEDNFCFLFVGINKDINVKILMDFIDFVLKNWETN